MSKLDPAKLFEQLATDIPGSLHEHLYVTGSLAAAYEFRTKLLGNAVNTKDADLVVHPAGNTQSCQKIAKQLLRIDWRKHPECYPQLSAEPSEKLRAIRLLPPDSNDYFIEFLNVPEKSQQIPKRFIEISLDDGWYGLPSFKYMGVTSLERRKSKSGFQYASPAMMALANVLAHPTLGDDLIESGEFKGIRRSAKDLGRVIALAWLSEREQVETWLPSWKVALEECFSESWRTLAKDIGNGLEVLVKNKAALQEARLTTEVGLLKGKNVNGEQLAATAEIVVAYVFEPLRELANTR